MTDETAFKGTPVTTACPKCGGFMVTKPYEAARCVCTHCSHEINTPPTPPTRTFTHA